MPENLPRVFFRIPTELGRAKRIYVLSTDFRTYIIRYSSLYGESTDSVREHLSAQKNSD